MNARVHGLLFGHSIRKCAGRLGTMDSFLPANPFVKQPQVEEQLLAELRASCGQVRKHHVPVISERSQPSSWESEARGRSRVQDDASGADERWRQLRRWLSLPPRYTTVRVNTRETSVEQARVAVQEHLSTSHVRFGEAPLVLLHPCLDELLLVVSRQCRAQVVPSSREVVVDADCGQAVLRGAHVFVPGVLGAPKGLEAGERVAVFADLEGSCLRGYARPYRGERAFLGNGTALVSRRDIFVSQLARGVAVRMTEPLFGCPPLNGLMTQTLLLQNLPSVLCGLVLGPQPGESVLDMCAAPGGKTTHLATLMDDKGLLVALDRAESRLSRVRALCDLWGLSCVRAHAHDANDYQGLRATVQDLPERFDRVLLDAPCSGLGQRPLLVCRQTAGQLRSYPPQQRALLDTAVRLLKPGGTLVYSTCTLTTSENEAIVAWALARFSELRLVPQEPHLGGVGRAGAGLDDDQRHLVQRFEGQQVWPESQDYNVDTIGFFIACFRKAE
uniref:Putative trna and rrna cytosine-c5-methylase nucleolar protein nol1/nop2 n=2 Tax=Ixodes ricinus TaxID=34613 RepID=V5HTK3_IXORI